MASLKGFSGLLIVFFSGIFVAGLVCFILFRQPSVSMYKVNLPQSPILGNLGDSIQLQNNVGSANHLKKPIEPNVVVERENKDSQKDQPVYGESIKPPTGDEFVNTPPIQEIVELPLDFEVFEEAPESETFENIADTAIFKEPSKPGVVENAPIPNYYTNK
jgi:hypothetical protein